MLTASPLRGLLGLVGWALILSLVFYLLELLAPAERGQPLRKRLLNLGYMPFNAAVIVLVLQPAFNRLYSHVPGLGLLPTLIDSRSGALAQLLFALFFAFVWDVWQYCVHRLQHSVPLLWRTHKFHHSETALNSSASTRHHSLSQLLYVALYLPPLMLFGPQYPHVVAAFVMFRLWGLVNHANLRIDLGPLTPVVSGPQWHRVHHSARAEHCDKNFAAFFPFIDILFGTYYGPRRGEYPPTGSPDREEIGFLRDATVEPFAPVTRTSLRPRRIGGRRGAGVEVARRERRAQS